MGVFPFFGKRGNGMKYRIPIEIKSLFFNIKNDNERGHTATVSSILKQNGSIHEDVARIEMVPENIHASSRVGIINHLAQNSRAEANINKICCFDKISVNGLPVKTDFSFCIYVREETAATNVHCGRKKIHYPPSFAYSDEKVNIDNRMVLRSISTMLGNYAFVVEAFEYDCDTGNLNFDAIIVGPKEIPYSKVFVNRKGVGSKFTSAFDEDYDDYDTEIIALRQKLGYNNVGPENFREIMDAQKNEAYKDIVEYLKSKGITECRNLNQEYPYSIYDFEYNVNGVKHFGIIRHSSTLLKKFVLSSQQLQFISHFSDVASIFLETDSLGRKDIHEYKNAQVIDMRKQIRSLSLDASEVCV